MIRIGVIGTGDIAGRMAETLTGMVHQGNDTICRYAAASREYGKAKAYAGKHGFEKAYGSYEELLCDEKVDLVYVATPHSHHYEHVRQCLDHGKHVLCEKSFTVNAAQARELIRMAGEKKLLLTEALWTRYMPSARILTDLIASGRIGAVRMMTADLSGNIAWRKRLLNPALAGGALLDEGVYVINLADMVMGDEIEELTGCPQMDPENGVDLQESITIRYRGGKMAVLRSSIIATGDRRAVISGEKGYITTDSVNNPQVISIYDDSRSGIPVENILVPKQITGYEYEVEACVKAIEEGRIECPEMPHEKTVHIMEIMDTLREQWGLKYPCE